ncbi:MAG: hypothetical protein RLP14_07415 [Owenweeksia sp.]
MGNKEPIDELFRTKLNDLEADTPYDSWPDLKNQLERRNRRKRIAYWRYSSVAAAVLLAFFSGYFFDDWNDTSNHKLKETGRPEIEIPENRKKDIVKSENRSSDTKPVQEESPHVIYNSERLKNDQKQDALGTRGMAGNNSSSKANTTPGKDVDKNDDRKNSSPKSLWAASENKAEVRKDDEGVSKSLAGNSEATESSIDESAPVESDLSNDQNPTSEDNTSSDKIALNSLPPLSASELAEIDGLTNKEKTKGTNLSNVELAVVAGPTVPFMNVNLKDNSTSTQNNVNNERLENTYATGVKVLIRNDRNWEWQAGLMVNNWVQNSNNILLTKQPATTSSGIPDPNNVSSGDVNGYTSLGNVKFDQNAYNQVSLTEELDQYYLVPNIGQEYQFLEIPIGAAYYILNNRFELKLQAGINTRILSNSNVYLEYPDGTTSDYEGLKPNNISLQLSTGPGFAYRITPRLKLQFDPMIYYGVTPINQSNNVETYYHQLLFFSGISYRF